MPVCMPHGRAHLPILQCPVKAVSSFCLQNHDLIIEDKTCSYEKPLYAKALSILF